MKSQNAAPSPPAPLAPELNWEEFRAWLGAQPPDERVISQHPEALSYSCHCPVAVWLRARYGLHMAAVGGHTYSYRYQGLDGAEGGGRFGDLRFVAFVSLYDDLPGYEATWAAAAGLAARAEDPELIQRERDLANGVRPAAASTRDLSPASQAEAGAGES